MPYQDPANYFPPHETLAALPPDGIAIVAWVSRSRGSGSEPRPAAALRAAASPNGLLRGCSSGPGDYRILAHVPGRFNVTLWIFFGRPDPSDEQLDCAQAELDRLRLPDWPITS